MPNSLKIISAVLKYLHAFRRTNKVMDGSFSVGARRYFKRILKPRNRDLPGKWCIASVRIRILLPDVWALDLTEYETVVLITQPRRRNLLKLTLPGYAVPRNDLERLWNEAALFVLLSLTFFCRDWRKTRKTLLKVAEICKPQANRPRHYGLNVLKPNPMLGIHKVKYGGWSENKFRWPVIW